MANAYFSIGTTTPIADIKSALQTQYGGGNVTVHYETTAYLIFSCSAIADKVIKMEWAAGYLQSYYGDAWTSGSTITNQVQFAGFYTGTTSVIHLVLGDAFFFLNLLASTINSSIAIIAKMTNNNYVCLGLIGYSGYATYTKGRDTTAGADIFPVTLERGFTSATSKLYKQPLILVKTSGLVEEETDGDIAAIPGLYTASYSTGSVSTLIKAANYLLSTCNMFLSDGVTYLRTCIFAEW